MNGWVNLKQKVCNPYFVLNSAASERLHTPLLCLLVFGSLLFVCLVLSAKLAIHQTLISVLPDCEI